MKATFSDIIGYQSIKEELKQIADALKNADDYAKLGVKTPRGLMLYGDPGLGKTLMATALSEESGLPVFLCRKTKSAGRFVDEITETFKKATEAAPAIVYLDDIDKFANADENHRDAEEYVTVQACIDEVKDKNVFVLATANDVRKLPRSLMRVGRFDRVIEVEAPHGEDAREIIRHYLDQKQTMDDLDYELIARIMDGRSCAELETVINEAGMYAVYDRSEKITTEHFLKACLRIVYKMNYTGDPDDYDDDDDEDYAAIRAGSTLERVAYHEAAHAVVNEVLLPGSVTLSTVCAGNDGSGGLTSYRRQGVEPGYLQCCRAVTSLAGMAVSEQVFGVCDMGSSHDLDMAFRLVKGMVGDLCSNGLGFYSFGYHESPENTRRVEEATTAEVERFYRKAKEVLAQNRAFLDAVAKRLMEKRLITCRDIEELRKTCKVVSVAL